MNLFTFSIAPLCCGEFYFGFGLVFNLLITRNADGRTDRRTRMEVTGADVGMGQEVPRPVALTARFGIVSGQHANLGMPLNRIIFIFRSVYLRLSELFSCHPNPKEMRYMPHTTDIQPVFVFSFLG